MNVLAQSTALFILCWYWFLNQYVCFGKIQLKMKRQGRERVWIRKKTPTIYRTTWKTPATPDFSFPVWNTHTHRSHSFQLFVWVQLIYHTPTHDCHTHPHTHRVGCVWVFQAAEQWVSLVQMILKQGPVNMLPFHHFHSQLCLCKLLN